MSAPILPPDSKRYLVRRLTIDGVPHPMALLTIHPDGTYEIADFVAEVHSTAYLPQATITTHQGRIATFRAG